MRYAYLILSLIFVFACMDCGGPGGPSSGSPASSGGPSSAGAPSSGGAASFAITPPNPGIVIKGQTLQFATDPAGLTVSWSVVGGDANGRIDAVGLFTAPSALPLNPFVTVQASRNGEVAQAKLRLYTDSSITWGNPKQMNDTPINDTLLLNETDPDKSASLVADRVGARSGSLDVYGAWNQDSDGARGPKKINPFLSAAKDLGEFLPEISLGTDESKSQLLDCLLTDSDKNPGIFFTNLGAAGSLLFKGSANQGQSFDRLTQVAVPASGNNEMQASAKADEKGIYHVVFVEAAAHQMLRFYQSDDRGKTFKKGGALPASQDASNGQTAPNLWVSENGQTIYICYNEGNLNTQDIYFTKSSDGGATFGSAVNVSNAPNTKDGLCRVAGGPNGEIYVAFSQGDPAVNTDILLKKSSDGGNQFALMGTVNKTTAGLQSLPFMAVDALGRIDIVWADNKDRGSLFPFRLFYSRSTDGGQSFPNEMELANQGNSFAFGMGLVHDEAGRPHLQYGFQTTEGNPFYDIYYRFGL